MVKQREWESLAVFNGNQDKYPEPKAMLNVSHPQIPIVHEHQKENTFLLLRGERVGKAVQIFISRSC